MQKFAELLNTESYTKLTDTFGGDRLRFSKNSRLLKGILSQSEIDKIRAKFGIEKVYIPKKIGLLKKIIVLDFLESECKYKKFLKEYNNISRQYFYKIRKEYEKAK